MPLSPEIIFAFSLVFNVAAKYIARFAGWLRHGIDSLLFCAIFTGYFYGTKAGILYGFLIAITFFLINLKWMHYALYVIPLNAAAGAFAALLAGAPLAEATLIVLLSYHALSFAIVSVGYRSVGFGYLLFTVLNFVTTYILVGIFAGL